MDQLSLNLSIPETEQLDFGFEYRQLRYQPNLDADSLYTRFWSDDLRPHRVGITRPSRRNKNDFIVVFPERRVGYLAYSFQQYVGESLSEAISEFLPETKVQSASRKKVKDLGILGLEPARDKLGRFIKRSEFSFNRSYSPYENLIVGDSVMSFVCAMYQTTCKRRNGNIEGRYCVGIEFKNEESEKRGRFWLEFPMKFHKLGNFWGLDPENCSIEYRFDGINRKVLHGKIGILDSKPLTTNLVKPSRSGRYELKTLLLELLYVIPISQRYANKPSIQFERCCSQASEFPLWADRFINFIDPSERKSVNSASHINEFLTVQTGNPLKLFEIVRDEELKDFKINLLSGKLGKKLFFGYLFHPNKIATGMDVNSGIEILKTLNTVTDAFGDVSYLNHAFEILETQQAGNILLFNKVPRTQGIIKDLLNLKIVEAFPRPKQWRIIDDAIGLFAIKSHPEFLRLAANEAREGAPEAYIANRVEEDATDSINMEAQILRYKVDPTEHIRGKHVKNLKDLHDQMTKLHITLRDKPKPLPEKSYEWLRDNLQLAPTLRIVIPKDDNTIKQWGQAQRHCLATYAPATVSGQCIIIGIEKVDPETGVGSYPPNWLGHAQFYAEGITSSRTSNSTTIAISQFYGQSNAHLDQKYHSLLKVHLVETLADWNKKLKALEAAKKEEERKMRAEERKKAKDAKKSEAPAAIQDLLI